VTYFSSPHVTPEKTRIDISAIQDSSRQTLLSIEDAKGVLKRRLDSGLLTQDEFNNQLQVLSDFAQAGMTNKLFKAGRTEIKEGQGRISTELGKNAVKNREDLVPLAITSIQRTVSTEMSNLVKRFEDVDSIVNHLKGVASKVGLEIPDLKYRASKYGEPRAMLNWMKEQPGLSDYFSDVYLKLHNPKSGIIDVNGDAPRSYPLRTMVSGGLKEGVGSLPESSKLSNMLNQTHQDVVSVLGDANLKRYGLSLNQEGLDASIKIESVGKMRESLMGEPEKLTQICKLMFGD
jgi:hypothetical protein